MKNRFFLVSGPGQNISKIVVCPRKIRIDSQRFTIMICAPVIIHPSFMQDTQLVVGFCMFRLEAQHL